MKECDLYIMGRCKKWEDWDGRHKCRPSTESWFDFPDKLEVIEVDEMCRRSSIFGNAFFKITKEQLKALEDGKVLFNLDEYGTFIMLER